MLFVCKGDGELNVIERFFRDLDEKRVHRGVFRSVPELIDAVLGYIDHHNRDPKPFVWRKTAEEIIEKVGRARLALNNAPTG